MYTRCGEESVSLRHKFRMVSVSASLGDVFGGVGLYSRPGESLRTQRHLEQFQKDFTYAMIHDMKSPLSSILMGAHILNSGKLSGKPGKEEKYRQAMMEECEHLLTLPIVYWYLPSWMRDIWNSIRKRCLCGLYLMI